MGAARRGVSEMLSVPFSARTLNLLCLSRVYSALGLRTHKKMGWGTSWQREVIMSEKRGEPHGGHVGWTISPNFT